VNYKIKRIKNNNNNDNDDDDDENDVDNDVDNDDDDDYITDRASPLSCRFVYLIRFRPAINVDGV